MSVFGSQNKRPSFFGSLAIPQPQQPANSLFGASSQQQAQPDQSSNVFASSFKPQQQAGGLFGGSSNTQQPSPFSSTPNQQQPSLNTQTSSLFNAPQQQQQQQQSGLFGTPQPFGSTSQQPLPFGSVSQQSQPFGSASQQQQQQQQPFGSTSQLQQQQQQQPTFGASAFGGSAQSQLQQPNRSLWQPSSSMPMRQKTIPEQMYTLFEKWSPESQNCVFQTYFYNNVQSTSVPYYGPSPGDDEQKWEEALSNKPSEDSIPVLCKGFVTLGNRLRVQVMSVAALQTRLHEINNSLSAMIQKHDLEMSVKTADAKRRHTALSRRCLTLATKIQVLRNRGYSMDGAEEEFKARLSALERAAFDPALGARQEEIWAKMVGIRERARFLQEEADKITVAANQEVEAIDEGVLQKTRKILGDYDSQISHLQRELSEVRKDFDDWQGGS